MRKCLEHLATAPLRQASFTSLSRLAQPTLCRFLLAIMSSTHTSLYVQSSPSTPRSPQSPSFNSYYWEATTPPGTEAPDPRTTFGYVDLTLDTPAPPSRRPSRTPDHMSHFSNRPWANEDLSRSRRMAVVNEEVEAVGFKRRRVSDSGRRVNSGQGLMGLRAMLVEDPQGMKKEGSVEQVDLRDVDDEDAVGKVLEKQRVDAVNLAKAESGKTTNFNSITCVICMEEMTDVTATHCGEQWPPTPQLSHGFSQQTSMRQLRGVHNTSTAQLLYLLSLIHSVSNRSHFLPRLSHGSAHCRRESRARARQRPIALSHLPKKSGPTQREQRPQECGTLRTQVRDETKACRQETRLYEGDRDSRELL